MDANSVKFHRTIMVEMTSLVANDYNPNRMPDIEMSLLKECINTYGFLFPLIVNWDEGLQKYRIIDGFHRYETLKRLGVTNVSVINLNITYAQAVQLTVLMNRIKGMHQVEGMGNLVLKLADLGLEDEEISNNLGMEAEELIRLKQQLGIAFAYKDAPYTNTWEVKVK